MGNLFKNRIVLVTGGAGFIGSHLLDRALAEGCEKAICFDNFCGGSEKNIRHLMNDKRFKLVRGDIAEYDQIKPYVEESDVIFNEAASKLVVSLKDTMTDMRTNVMGNLNICEILRRSGRDARVIHASTGSVFGSSEKPFHEDDAKNPSTAYGITKLCADNYYTFYAKNYGLRASVLRYFHVFGPRQDYAGEAGVINIFLSRILKGEAPVVFGTGEQIRCFTYIADDVEANMLLYRNNSSIGKAYNVAAKTRISVLELARKLIDRYGDNRLAPVMGAARIGENLRPIPDTSRIEALGFRESVSFDEGLDLTKDWIEKDMSS